MNILEFRNVSLTYHTSKNEILALKDVSFTVKDGEFVAFVGPSGCGKTTILSLIAGVLKASSGEIIINGQDITKQKNHIGYMFQHDHLFEWRSIWKNVVLGLEIQHKMKDENLVKRASDLLETYGLAEFKTYKPSQLSGGMRQRVALIRTLAVNPQILLLDEPFSALDFQTRLSVCDDVSRIISEEKKTAILVTHDIYEAISMADRIIVLTKRPAEIKKVYEINLKEYGLPFKRRDTDQARKLFEEIWKELTDEED